jgi:hypothetical protein
MPDLYSTFDFLAASMQTVGRSKSEEAGGFGDIVSTSWDKFKTFIKKIFSGIGRIFIAIWNGITFLITKFLNFVTRKTKETTVAANAMYQKIVKSNLSIGDVDNGVAVDFVTVPKENFKNDIIPAFTYVRDNLCVAGAPVAKEKNAAKRITSTYEEKFRALVDLSGAFTSFCNRVLLASNTMTAEFCREFYGDVVDGLPPYYITKDAPEVEFISMKVYKIDLLAKTCNLEEKISGTDYNPIDLKNRNDGTHLITISSDKDPESIKTAIKAQAVSVSKGIDPKARSQYTTTQLFGGNTPLSTAVTELYDVTERVSEFYTTIKTKASPIEPKVKALSSSVSTLIKRLETGLDMINIGIPGADLYQFTITVYAKLLTDFTLAVAAFHTQYKNYITESVDQGAVVVDLTSRVFSVIGEQLDSRSIA